MRFLFATLQYRESDFYGRVGSDLERRGHEVAHLTCSRRAARLLTRRGAQAHCLPELTRAVDAATPWRQEARRIVSGYPLEDLREVYGADPAGRGKDDEDRLVERTVRHFLAIEGLFEQVRPELVLPEVGNESIRKVSHLVGTAQGATTLFLMHTLFDDPLRLTAGTLDAPIVSPEELRALSPTEQAELEGFIARFTERNRPIREPRRVSLAPRRVAVAARHFGVRALWDRDNEYLTPGAWLVRDLREKARWLAARRLYETGPPRGSFIYFPLQVADDYKLISLRPHLADQEAIVERLVSGLPPGIELVVKEHPMSIGRTPLGMLRRLARAPRVHLAPPLTSSLDLVRGSSGVATISSTVGLEALLYGCPVLTLGTPFYSGYGVTLDVTSLEEAPRAVRELHHFRPDSERTRRFLGAAMRHCHPGAPVLVDSSQENAKRLAVTLDRAASGELAQPLVGAAEFA